jgi:hypothetical protein
MLEFNDHLYSDHRQSGKKRKHPDHCPRIDPRQKRNANDVSIYNKYLPKPPDNDNVTSVNFLQHQKVTKVDQIETTANILHDRSVFSRKEKKCSILQPQPSPLWIKSKKCIPTKDLKPVTPTESVFDTPFVRAHFWNSVLNDNELVEKSHVGLVSDAVIFAMAQMKRCGLTVDDRIGKYKNRDLGYPGICCKYCEKQQGQQPGFGRKYYTISFSSEGMK